MGFQVRSRVEGELLPAPIGYAYPYIRSYLNLQGLELWDLGLRAHGLVL